MCPQTVGALTVVAASVSGVYRCVASNSAGSDHLDHHFYVTGDPVISVFEIRKTSASNDLHLNTCQYSFSAFIQAEK